MQRIAVTGSVGTGKSTFCTMLKALGATVVSADAIVHALLAHSHFVNQQLVQRFGDQIIVDGAPCRKRLAKAVFNSSDDLTFLEQLLHPLVFEEIQKLARQAEQENVPLFVAEVPLLFEGKHRNDYGLPIVVIDTPERSLERWISNGRDPTDFQQRNQRLLPLNQKIPLAHTVIDNSSDLQHLHGQARSLYETLVKKNGSDDKNCS